MNHAGHPIYFDAHATTPVDPQVLQEMLPYFSEKFGNPASALHSYGWTAEEAVRIARERTAALLGVTPYEIIFTSGATESNNLALHGALTALGPLHECHAITSATEHKSVLMPLKALQAQGLQLTVLTPQPGGEILLSQIEAALTPQTKLVSLMWANNEIGTIHNIEAVAKLCRSRGVLLHSDATQSPCWMSVQVGESGPDLVSLSGHKMYGPKGVGALFVRRKNPRVALQPQITGGGQERSIRPGTLNVPAIVGMGAAAQLALNNHAEDSSRVSRLRDTLWNGLKTLPTIRLNGSLDMRLSNNINVTISNIKSESFLAVVCRDLALSGGSACTGSEGISGSHVLIALGHKDDNDSVTLRFGLGRNTTSEQVSTAINTVTKAFYDNQIAAQTRKTL